MCRFAGDQEALATCQQSVSNFIDQLIVVDAFRIVQIELADFILRYAWSPGGGDFRSFHWRSLAIKVENVKWSFRHQVDQLPIPA
jgi:hypothetical protein